MNRLLPWLLALLPAANAAQVLTLHYQERPPYSSVQPDGTVSGLVATPAAAALDKAGIAYQWQLTPGLRQLALIQAGHGLHCGIGWFHNPERATKGRFSAPLYRDRPMATLVRDGLPVATPARLTALLADDRLRLLVKDGYSYGAELDRLLAAPGPVTVRTSVDPPQMSQMLRAGRADWMLVAPEEAAALGGPGLRLVALSDVPGGSARHLYCSADLPAAWLERLNRALAAR